MRKAFMDIKVTNINKVGSDIMFICFTFDDKKSLYIEMNDFNVKDLTEETVCILPQLYFSGQTDQNIVYENGNTNCMYIRSSQAEASKLIINHFMKHYGTEPFFIVSAKEALESSNLFILLNELKEVSKEYSDKINNSGLIYDIETPISLLNILNILHLNDEKVMEEKSLSYINNMLNNLKENYNPILKTRTLYSLYEVLDVYYKDNK